MKKSSIQRAAIKPAFSVYPPLTPIVDNHVPALAPAIRRQDPRETAQEAVHQVMLKEDVDLLLGAPAAAANAPQHAARDDAHPNRPAADPEANRPLQSISSVDEINDSSGSRPS